MFSKTLERLLILVIIIFASKYNVLAGLFSALLYIYFFNNNIIENFDRNNRQPIRPQQIKQNQTMYRQSNTNSQNVMSSSNVSTNRDNKGKQRGNNEDGDLNESDTSVGTSLNSDEGYIKNNIAKQQKKLSKDTKIDDANLFRNKYCNQDGVLIKNNVPVNDVNLEFPNLKYKDQTCNPCNTSCDFDIISTNEQLTLQENMKSIDSNTIDINRKNTIKKNN